MRETFYRIAGWIALALSATALATGPATASTAAEFRDSSRYSGFADSEDQALPYLQCVPYARQVSGIQIYGDALTWWQQAEGRYAKGHKPKPGAVMSFAPFGRMELGHVAAVSRVIDSRTVLLRHANWSPIDGRRGQIENDVRAVDVSPQNDWSEVRVWYAPIGNLGTTAWPVNGFIYPDKPVRAGRHTVLASIATTSVTKPGMAEKPASGIGADFLRGIRPEVTVRSAPVRQQLAYSYTDPKADRTVRAHSTLARPSLANDPIGRIIAAKTR